MPRRRRPGRRDVGRHAADDCRYEDPCNGSDSTEAYFGGNALQDIYRTFMTGLNGVPMPSYTGVISEDEAWHLVNFVLSLDREGF